MADAFPNPYAGASSPIAAALANLSRVMMSGPSDAKRIAEAEAALALKNKREGFASAADMFRQFGTDAFNRNEAAAAMLRGGQDPSKFLPGTELYLGANQYGVADPRVTNAGVGSGMSMASTPGGFAVDQSNAMARHRMSLDQNQRQFETGQTNTNNRAQATLDENRRQFNETPTVIDSPTGPVYATRQGAIGQPAAEGLDKVKGSVARRAVNSPEGVGGLPPAEQRLIGAESKAAPTPRNWRAHTGETTVTYDGITDARTGQPLPPGMLATAQGTPEQVGPQSTEIAARRKALLESRVSTSRAVQTLDDLDKQLQQPNADASIGFLGRAAGFINGVRSQVEAGARMAGVQIQAPLDINAYQGTFRQLGVQNAQTASVMLDLAFSIASAREPGKLTADDVNRAIVTIGGHLGDPVAMRQVLGGVRQRLLRDYDTSERVAREVYGDKLGLPGFAVPPAAGAAPGAAPSPAAPGAPERWERGPDGRMRRVQ